MINVAIMFLPLYYSPRLTLRTFFLVSDAQQCPQPVVSQPQQPTLDVPIPGEIKEETMSSPHIRAGSGVERGVDPVKIENIGGGAGRQAGGPPGQGYSKYQKSLPPRFQRQQQVRIYTYLLS